MTGDLPNFRVKKSFTALPAGANAKVMYGLRVHPLRGHSAWTRRLSRGISRSTGGYFAEYAVGVIYACSGWCVRIRGRSRANLDRQGRFENDNNNPKLRQAGESCFLPARQAGW